MTKEEMKQKAEEYVELSGNRNYTERAYIDGLEFGYNRAREELLEQAKNYIEETASGTPKEMFTIEQFYIAGLLDGYAKGKAEMQDKLETAF